MPRVSVVVPVRNAARTLPDCLSALERLDPAPNEILLVDNGSTDPSASVLREFSERIGSRVRVLAEAKRGASAARNAGIREASGNIIAFTDADCIPASDWLDALVGPFTDPAVGAVAGRVSGSPPASTTELFGALYTLRSPESPGRHESWSPRSGGFPTANLAVRRKLALELAGFDEEAPTGEDYDLCARLYERGSSIAYTPDARVLHRHRKDVRGLLRQAFGFGRGHAYLLRRHGRRLLWIDGPGGPAAWKRSPVSAWLDLASADKKLLAILLLGSLHPLFWWAAPLYVLYLVGAARNRARVAGHSSSAVTSVQLAALLVLKSAAMTAGRWWGSLRYRALCF